MAMVGSIYPELYLNQQASLDLDRVARVSLGEMACQQQTAHDGAASSKMVETSLRACFLVVQGLRESQEEEETISGVIRKDRATAVADNEQRLVAGFDEVEPTATVHQNTLFKILYKACDTEFCWYSLWHEPWHDEHSLEVGEDATGT